MLTGLLVVLAVLSVRARFDDPDMWWHLRTGQIIWTTRTVPKKAGIPGGESGTATTRGCATTGQSLKVMSL